MSVNKKNYNWFKPYFVEVGIPIGTPDIKVRYSPFSAPPESLPTGYRGIADIDFEIDPKDSDVEVILQVYVYKHEEGFGIKAEKDGEWIDFNTEFVADRRGRLIGYLEAIIKPGDPPIAVG